jgi:hypothetical protein
LHRDAAAAAKEAILGATLHFNAGGVDFLFMLKSEEAEGTYSGSAAHVPPTTCRTRTTCILPAAELRGDRVSMYVHSARLLV